MLHYRAGGLLQYRAFLLHYRAVITLSGVFYYIIGHVLQYRAFITLSVGTRPIDALALANLAESDIIFTLSKVATVIIVSMYSWWRHFSHGNAVRRRHYGLYNNQ